MTKTIALLLGIATAMSQSQTPALRFVAVWGGHTKDIPAALITDGSGAVYVAGSAYSRDFPTTDGHRLNGYWCAFVTKLLSATGSAIHSTALCASGDTWGMAAVPRQEGELWVAGSTRAKDLPVTIRRAQRLYGGSTDPVGTGDGFIARWSRDGRARVYLTYLGGRGEDIVQTLTADGAGGVWVAGRTTSDDFPVSADAPQARPGGGEDGFLAHIDRVGRLTFATYVGRADHDDVSGVLRLEERRIVLAGTTSVRSTTAISMSDGVLRAFDTRTRIFTWQRRFGGHGSDQFLGVALVGDAILATGASDSASCDGRRARRDAWVVMVSTAGDAKADYCIGGSKVDVITGVAVAPDGSVWITGETASPDFPLGDSPLEQRPVLKSQAFVARLEPVRRTLSFATLIGNDRSAREDFVRGAAIAVAGDGAVFATGTVSGTTMATTAGAFSKVTASTDIYLVGLTP